VVLVAWTYCVVSLGRQFKKMTTGEQVAVSAQLVETL
jgi:hypothetical protein